MAERDTPRRTLPRQWSADGADLYPFRWRSENIIKKTTDADTRSSSGRVSEYLNAVDDKYVVNATLPDGRTKQLQGEVGMRVRDLIADIILEFKISEYRIKSSDTLALLNSEADAVLLANKSIIFEDSKGDVSVYLPQDADDRLRIFYRIFQSEKNYLECLHSLKLLYSEPLRKCTYLSQEEYAILFSWIEPMIAVCTNLFTKLQSLVLNWETCSVSLETLFSSDLLARYEDYYLRHPSIRMILNERKHSDPEFAEFCQQQRGAARHSLDSLLLLPVQRIPQYDQYLSTLLDKTPVSHPAYGDLCPVVDKVNNMVKERDNEIQVAENQNKLEQVQERFPHDNLQLMEKHAVILQKSKSLQIRRRSAPTHVLSRTFSSKSKPSLSTEKSMMDYNGNRAYVMEGPVQLTTGVQSQHRYFFLFNDVLLIAKTKSGTNFRLKQKIRVNEMWVGSCLEEVCETNKSAERSFVLGWPIANNVVTFPSADVKQLWLDTLNRYIKEERMKEVPKILNLKIINQDLNCYPYSKKIPVCNTDDCNEVIRLCVEQFKFSDYQSSHFQLWVQSGKEEIAYPLIGHEIPFAIRMNHLRDVLKNEDVNLTADLDASMEDFPPELQCNFVLRLIQKSSDRIKLDVVSAQKRFKKQKKTSLINFKFRRSTSKTGDSVDSGTVPPRLFGLPLGQVCPDGKLPSAISELLVHLYHNAPFLTGVFRKSANARVCRELRQKLESGDECNFDDYPVLVTATVMKDFLRGLPDCIFSTALYDSWMEANDMTDELEKRNTLKLTFEKLGEINQDIVKQFFCILHYIDKNSEENNMNAYNLSICVGQSLLWPPSNRGATVTADASKKIPTLMQYILENLHAILGENVTSIFGAPPIKASRHRSRSSDSGSGWDSDSTSENTGHMKRDDESLDSLDRELSYNETNTQYHTHSNQLSPSNLSKDSVIHLSDSQLFTESDTTDTTDSGYDSKMLSVSPNGNIMRTGSITTNPNSPNAIPRGFGRRHRRKSEPLVSPGVLLHQPDDSTTDCTPQDNMFYQREPLSDSKISVSKRPKLSEMRRKNILEFGYELDLDSSLLSPRFCNDMIKGLQEPSQIVQSKRIHPPQFSRMHSDTASSGKDLSMFQVVACPPTFHMRHRSNSESSLMDLDFECTKSRRPILSPELGRKFTSPLELFYVGEPQTSVEKRTPPSYESHERNPPPSYHSLPRGPSKSSLTRSKVLLPKDAPKKRTFTPKSPNAVSQGKSSTSTMQLSKSFSDWTGLTEADHIQRNQLNKSGPATYRVHKCNTGEKEKEHSPPTEFFPSHATTSTLSTPCDNDAKSTRSLIRRTASDPPTSLKFHTPPTYEEAMNRRAVLHHSPIQETSKQALTVQNMKTVHSQRTLSNEDKQSHADNTPNVPQERSRKSLLDYQRKSRRDYAESNLQRRIITPRRNEQTLPRKCSQPLDTRIEKPKVIHRSCSDNYEKRLQMSVFFTQDSKGDCDSCTSDFSPHQTPSGLKQRVPNTAKNITPTSSEDNVSQCLSEESYV